MAVCIDEKVASTLQSMRSSKDSSKALSLTSLVSSQQIGFMGKHGCPGLSQLSSISRCQPWHDRFLASLLYLLHACHLWLLIRSPISSALFPSNQSIASVPQYIIQKNSSQSAPRTLISLRNHFSEDDRIIIRTPGETEIVGGLLVGGPHIYDISPDSDMLKEHKAD